MIVASLGSRRSILFVFDIISFLGSFFLVYTCSFSYRLYLCLLQLFVVGW